MDEVPLLEAKPVLGGDTPSVKVKRDMAVILVTEPVSTRPLVQVGLNLVQNLLDGMAYETSEIS